LETNDHVQGVFDKNHLVDVGVAQLVGDLEHWRRTFDKLNDTLDDIDAVISQSETSLSDISQSTAVSESQRLQRLLVSLSVELDGCMKDVIFDMI